MPSIAAAQPIRVFHHLCDLLPNRWSRDRGSLRPPHVLVTIMSMSVLGYRSYKRTMGELARVMGAKLGWDRAPAASSFSEARRKLTPAQCHQAFEHIVAQCHTARDLPGTGYQEFRLIALDGTRLELPPCEELRRDFGCPKTNRGTEALAPQASLFVAWDVGRNMPVRWKLDRGYASERLAGYELAEHFGPGDLLILDRLYVSRRMIATMGDRGADFLLRLTLGRAGSFLEALRFVESGEMETVVQLHRTNQRRGQPELTVRLIKEILPNGKVAVWATSLLDAAAHPREALVTLYRDRWRIETAFREMKIWHGLEDFHARFTDGIHQEVAGIMTFMALAAELDAQARAKLDHTVDEDGRLHYSHRFNRLIVSDGVVALMIAAIKGPKEVAKEYEFTMHEIWRSKERVRTGRSYPRRSKSPSGKFKATTWRA